jgi:spermidine synthase
MDYCRLLKVLLGASTLLALARPANVRAEASEPPPEADCSTQNLLAGKQPTERQGVQGEVEVVTDARVAPEGARWDAPAAAVLESSTASLTYDLGQLRTIRALYVQADANDTYQVLGSRDGTPGSFQFLNQISSAIQLGHGLRSRSVVVAPATARYLRLGGATGDNSYSVAEFAAYCQVPTPFPPEMPTVDAPRAPSAGPAPGGPAKLEEPRSANPVLLMVAAALVLVGAATLLATRRPSQKKTGVRDRRSSERGRRARRRHAASDPESVPPDIRDDSEPRDATHDRLRWMFLASGCAALIYEVVWVHLLRLVIGASALSVGIVLASFMGGMFLGSLYFARFVPQERNSLRVYGWLEIGIGVCGLLMPLVLPLVRSVYVGLVGYGAWGIALRAVIAAGLLLPPTALMGATLPSVARRYGQGSRGMSGLASLYAANTAGAVLGSLLSAFYLLAVWDVWVATIVAATLNLSVGRYALGLSQRVSEARAAPESVPAKPEPEETRITHAVYLVAALSGMTALGAQVVWTRLLTLLFGATVYAFAIILAVFLGGLGLGSAFAAYLIRRGQNPVRGLAWSQLGLVPTLWFAGQLLAGVLPYASPSSLTPIAALHAMHVLRAIDVILPAAVLWGMSFPYALAAAGAGQHDTGRSSGLVYAANTVGAIVGSLGISFLVIPTWGTQWAEQSLVLVAGVSAAVLFFWIRRARPGTSLAGPESKWLSPAWVLAMAALGAAFLPGLSTVFKAHGRYIWWVDPADKYPYVSEGAASTVAVHIGPDGYSNFHVSGRVEATNNPNDLRTERLIGQLSALTHPGPESVLVVGLGAGITAGSIALHPEVKRIVICEIEPRVVGAANQFTKENYAVLSDPRVEVIFDDARHFLATTRERFDVITSDPIHPWVRGNSVLFSREYYAIVSARLRPGGIATQWVPLSETSEEAIKIQMRTFIDAFPHGTVWNTMVTGKGYDVVLVGRREPLVLDVPAIQKRMALPRIGQSLQEVKIGSVVDLLATYGTRGPDMQSWLANTPANRDFSLKLEYISGLALNSRDADSIYAHMIEQRTFPEEMFIAPPETMAELRRRLPAASAAKKTQ